ncbi:hypothetical protein Psi02_43480 [Planotetraspora silvatica]|uniref:Uncharacterized protein n=1 Tax=Planotetraspora silvatica TaxID=234614 RepID=A0A8J3UT73_9ACTN|nr:hypothetical protein [Planotetraspora silvatica]GII47924.1 hypothetical protein Psi02_43480 [Planotetraspora silvatica]
MATYTNLVFVSDDDLQSVAAGVTLALGVTLEWRESWYRGGDYLLSTGGSGEERTSVQRNAEMDELAEPDYPDALTLVRVEGRADRRRLSTALAKSA